MKALAIQNFAILCGFALLVGVGGFLVWENAELKARVEVVDGQMRTLVAALTGMDTFSEEAQVEIAGLFQNPSGTRTQDELLTEAVAEAAPAVVSIVISKDMPRLEIQYVDPFGDRGSRFRVPVYRHVGTERREIGAGTGFVVREDGYIVTNRHVVQDPEALYTVLLSTGEQKEARVVYRDAEQDLAMLKTEGSGYPTMQFADSENLKLGQTVMAIGNALGEYSNSVSVGIVSGMNRTIEAIDSEGRIESLAGVIQTDAAINRGNSGGPLIDLSGRVVGINVAVDAEGSAIGFAIPANAAKELIESTLPSR